MRTIFSAATAVFLSSIALLPAANAQTPGTLTQNPETGHYYQVFKQNAGTWDGAESFVAIEANVPCLSINGAVLGCSDPTSVKPHLATITSAREEVFVDTLRNYEFNGFPAGGFPDGNPDNAGKTAFLDQGQTWIGGIQDGGGAEPFAGWRWINGEGNFPGMNGGVVYTNWASAEPNNSGGEDHLTLGRYGLGGGWNDELQGRASMGGFIVEWDVPLDAGTCAGGSGCVTVEGQTLIYPEGVSGQVSFNSFELLDPRVAAGTCGIGPGSVPLTIFGGTGIGPNTPEMIIPPYLCGSPKLVVVAVETNFDIETGTVGVIHDTKTVLPGNLYADGGVSVCEDPIPMTPYTDGDPQYQDVVVWQSTDPMEMREYNSGVAGMGGYFGAAGEFTNECGTSRARVKGLSYLGIGLHIEFGPGNEYNPSTFLANFNSFVNLTRYKLDLLKDSLDDAQSSIPKKGDRQKMNKSVANAIKNFDQGNYGSALSHITNFLKWVDKADYDLVAGENYRGEHLMRGSNLEFMLRVKIIPYIPAP